jgi:DNA-binding transcriptional LysR family regulator
MRSRALRARRTQHKSKRPVTARGPTRTSRSPAMACPIVTCRRYQRRASAGLSPGLGRDQSWDVLRAVPVPGEYGKDDCKLNPAGIAGVGDAAKHHRIVRDPCAAPQLMVAPYRRDGRLRYVLEKFETEPIPIQVVYPQARLMSNKVRAFVDECVRKLRQIKFD